MIISERFNRYKNTKLKKETKVMNYCLEVSLYHILHALQALTTVSYILEVKAQY